MTSFINGCSGSTPEKDNTPSRQLSPCPDSPNCVFSLSSKPEHFIEPLHYSGSDSEAMSALLNVLLSMKRSCVRVQDDYYLHAEFSSLLFRFVDDVEFSMDPDTKTIHVRSASRLGYYDFGVNRRRIEKIRILYSGQMP